MIESSRLIQLFFELVKIPSPSFQEDGVREFLKQFFSPYDCSIKELKSASGTSLLLNFEGEAGAGGLVLCAHLDTVEEGEIIIEPAEENARLISKGETILGADNKASVAMFCEAVRILKERGLAHRPFGILFTFGEEKHLAGIREFSVEELPYSDVLLLDASGPVGSIIVRSPYHRSFVLEIGGQKAHAGIEPEKGVNAIKRASELINWLPQGRLDEATTFNIGKIQGGIATNIVPDMVRVEGEFRSFEREKIVELTQLLEELIRDMGEAKVHFYDNYQGYVISEEDLFYQQIFGQLKTLGIDPVRIPSGGGSDANILRAQGVNAVNLTSGMQNPHSPDEYILTEDLVRGCQLVLNLLLEVENFRAK